MPFSFCNTPSDFDVLLDSNLSRLPFLRQVIDRSAILKGFYSEPADLFLKLIFNQRTRKDLKIERRDGFAW